MNELATAPVVLRPSTKQRLDALKVHPRESYDDVVRRLTERQTARAEDEAGVPGA